jgi:hypothetical protein
MTNKQTPIRSDLPDPVVEDLRESLKSVEDRMAQLLKNGIRTGEERDSLVLSAAGIRTQLFELTGDWYGKPKIKIQKPDDSLLEAVYESPDEVPTEVMSWVRKHSAILTSDATDAVRWARIVDTVNDDRLVSGDVTLYRAIEKGAGMIPEIRPGDWVTPERTYAEDHLRRFLGGSGDVLEITVDGQDVLVSPTGNFEEAIYAPRELSGPVGSLATKKRSRKP